MSIGKNHLEDFAKTPEVTKQPLEITQETPVAEVVEPTKETEILQEVVDTKQAEPTNDITEFGKTTELEKEVVPAKETVVVEDSKPLAELNDDAILAYFKEKKGKELTSLDELFKAPEQASDIYEGLSDDTVQFIKYSKETGRDYKDFQALNRDIDKVPTLELARERAIALSGGKLTKDEVDGYLEKKLNIDLSDPEQLEKYDEIDLEAYVGDYRKDFKTNQEKYKQPIERKEQKGGPDMVTLEDGSLMEKAVYAKIVNDRNTYLEESKKAQDNITASTFEVTIDDNGNEVKMSIPFDFGKNDKHNMLSYASDTNEFINKNFSTDGKLDHAKLQKGLWFSLPENQGKVISAAVNKARAEWIEESMKESTNANFNTKKIPSEQQKGRTIPIPGTQSSHGVKFPLEMFTKK
jgi:hypothetical protein